MSWLAPSASRLELQGEVEADVRERGRELVEIGAETGCAAREQGDLVVGRHAAVGVEPVEADPGGGAEGAIELVGGEHGIGRDHDEHRREARREHPGALRHAADAPAVAAARPPSSGRVSVVMMALRGIRSAVGRQGRGGGRDPGEELAAVELVADQPGRADEHVAGGDAELVPDRPRRSRGWSGTLRPP